MLMKHQKEFLLYPQQNYRWGWYRISWNLIIDTKLLTQGNSITRRTKLHRIYLIFYWKVKTTRLLCRFSKILNLVLWVSKVLFWLLLKMGLTIFTVYIVVRYYQKHDFIRWQVFKNSKTIFCTGLWLCGWDMIHNYPPSVWNL